MAIPEVNPIEGFDILTQSHHRDCVCDDCLRQLNDSIGDIEHAPDCQCDDCYAKWGHDMDTCQCPECLSEGACVTEEDMPYTNCDLM